MAENVLGPIFGAGGESAKAALESLRTQSAATFETIVENTRRATPAFEQTRRAIERLSHSSQSAFEQMRSQHAQWSNSAVTTFGRVAELLQRHIGVEQLAAVETGRAESQKTLMHKAAIQERAAVEAVRETAAGLAALGDFNFWSAAQHFASATLWGSLAALQVASAVGAFGASGGRESGAGSRGGASTFSAPGPAPQMASGFAGATGGGGSSGGNVHVLIMGEPEGAAWVAGALNRHVQQRGGKLVSSSTQRPVSAGA